MGYVNNRTAVANSIIWCYFSPQHSAALPDPSLNTDICPMRLCILFSFKCICIKSHRIALYIFTCFPGSGKPSPYYYSSPTREEPRRTQVNITILHKCLVPLHSYLLLLYTLSLVYLCRIFYTAVLMYAVF